MVRLNRIYTRTGDAGETGLVDGSRRSKADALLAAIGDVDEANSAIGLCMSQVDETTATLLGRIQNEMFDLGADLATPGEQFDEDDQALRISQGQVDRLENDIDQANEGLAPLRSFVLPAGGAGADRLYFARAIVRRAERSAVAAAASEPLNPLALAYLNRLSDHLFVMARRAAAGGCEVLWQPGATRA